MRAALSPSAGRRYPLTVISAVFRCGLLFYYSNLTGPTAKWFQ